MPAVVSRGGHHDDARLQDLVQGLGHRRAALVGRPAPGAHPQAQVDHLRPSAGSLPDPGDHVVLPGVAENDPHRQEAHSGATPRPPTPLPATAPMIPATAVP